MGVAVLRTSIIKAVNVDTGSGDVSYAQLDQLAAGLRLDGVIACIIALTGWAILAIVERPSSAMTSVTPA